MSLDTLSQHVQQLVERSNALAAALAQADQRVIALEQAQDQPPAPDANGNVDGGSF